MTYVTIIAEEDIGAVLHAPPCELRIARPMSDDRNGRHANSVLNLPVATTYADALHTLVAALQSEATGDVGDGVMTQAVANGMATSQTADR